MTTQNEVIRALRDFAHASVFLGWRKMLTGRRTETNTITLAGAPAGKTWVRAHDASREQTAVWGFVGIPNVTIWVAPGVDGENRIMAIDYAESVQSHGDKVLLAQQPPLDGNLNTVLISGQNFQPGRLRAYAESGSMLVYVEPLAHRDGYYAGGTIDLTGDVPATSGTNAWVAVALDPATGTLYAYQGSESYDSISNLDVDDAHAISVPDTYLKLGAVALNSDTTEITPGTRIIDLRSYLSAVGYPALDSLGNVDTTGKSDGDALVWDAGAGEWVPGAGGGGVSDAADVTYTPADVTDWNSSADPGDVDNALDQLADRVKTAEGDIAGLSGGGISSAGWVALGETLAYGSAADPTYTATCAGVDLTSTLSVGMKLRVSQTTGGTKYFIITAIAFSTDTTLTLYGGTDYDLVNEAISNPYFSVVKAPHGFPLDPTKWTVELKDTTLRIQGSLTRNIWYNIASLQLKVPIGVWDLSYQAASFLVSAAASGAFHIRTTLSTANNAESDADFTVFHYIAGTIFQLVSTVHRSKVVALASATTYYLNVLTPSTPVQDLRLSNEVSPLIIRARCAYL